MPFGETESDVGVSVCPVRDGSEDEVERMSRTYTIGQNDNFVGDSEDY